MICENDLNSLRTFKGLSFVHHLYDYKIDFTTLLFNFNVIGLEDEDMGTQTAPIVKLVEVTVITGEEDEVENYGN